MLEAERVGIFNPEKPLQERCGIVAIYNPTDNIAEQLNIALLAARGVWHRGQQGAGISMQTDSGIRKHTGTGSFEQVFSEEKIKDLQREGINTWTLVHCRYGTSGGYQPENLQPITVTTRENDIVSIVHNGEFVNTPQMEKSISQKLPEGASDTYLFAQLLANQKGNNWDERVLNALKEVNGAYSLAIGINNELYLARDQFGIRPLVIGKIGGGWIAASETHALDKVGVAVTREIKRGEILKLNKDGMKTLQKGFDGKGNFCDFELAYFSRPDSLFPPHTGFDESNHPETWRSVLSFREACGRMLAIESPIPNATFAVGIPDSGTAVTTGYANQLQIPYRQVILRDHYDPNGSSRLFQGDNAIEAIGGRVLGKLSIVADPEIWEDAIVVVGDDSIVRGNVSQKITASLFAQGAKEVHWISGFPQVRHPCHLGVSMRTQQELIAARNDGDSKKIAEEIGATSVHYISHVGFIKARLGYKNIVMPKNPREIFLANRGCGGCITGLYPISKEGVVYASSK